MSMVLSFNAVDELDDVADGMIPDSRIVKIIDQMELAKCNVDTLKKTKVVGIEPEWMEKL